MPIEPTGLPTTDQQKTTESSQVKVSKSEATAQQQESEVGKSNTSDTVTLTEIAAKLHHLEETLTVLPTVDTQRVEDIKKLFEQGDYQIDNNRTAEKFLEFELQLAR